MRLVDLHCDWLRQYADETTQHLGRSEPALSSRLGRLDGYLLGTSLAVLACTYRPGAEAEASATSADPWSALGLMLARYESEFAGRLIRDPPDVALWRSSSPGGMCWGVLKVAGFDGLVRGPDDLERLPDLFRRGVRVFQPVEAAGGVLGGSSEPGDDRGLSSLGRAFLDRLATLAPGGDTSPRPILDLAGLSARAIAETLRWYDEGSLPGPDDRRRILLAASHGQGGYRDLADPASAQALGLAELRARGVTIGLTPGLPGCEAADELKALIDAIAAAPFEGRPGFEGIAIGADLLGVDRAIPGLDSARGLARWLEATFDRETSAAIVARNARRLLLRSAGLAES
ncbi:MAG: membrane dipeptidase [Isosphaeraceae bacterium]